jgi:hypothetical protein
MSVLPRPVQSGVVIAGASALAWARWGDTALGAGRRALDFGRALSEGLDGIAATRGISKTQAGLEALKASLGQSVSEFGVFKSAAVGAAAGLASFGATTAVLENLAKFHGDVRGLGTDLEQLGRGVATLDDVCALVAPLRESGVTFRYPYFARRGAEVRGVHLCGTVGRKTIVWEVTLPAPLPLDRVLSNLDAAGIPVQGD